MLRFLLFFSIVLFNSPFISLSTEKGKGNSLDSYQQLGQTLVRKGRYDEAISILQPYMNELDLPTLLALEKAFSKKENVEGQAQVLDFLVLNFKNEFLYKYYFRLGKVKLSLKKENQAIQYFRKSIELHSKYKPAYKALVELFLSRKESYEALMYVKDMGKIFGQEPSYFSLLCELYSMRGLFKETLENCDKAISLFPKSYEHYLYKIQAYKDSGNDEKSIQLLLELSRLFQGNAPLQERVGKHYFEKKDFSLASRYFSKAIQKDPFLASAQVFLARSSFELGEYDKALKGFMQACHLTQKTPLEFKNAAARLRRNEKNKKGEVDEKNKKNEKNKKWAYIFNLNLQNCLTQKYELKKK